MSMKIFIYSLCQWFPTSGRDPIEDRGDTDVESREGFMENMYELFKQRSVTYMFCVFDIVPKIFNLISNIKNLIFCKWQYYVVLKKINIV